MIIHSSANLASLIAETMTLYREKKIKAVEPLEVFDVSDIAQAYRYFGNGSRIGKVAISLQNPESMVPVSRDRVLLYCK